MINLDFVLTHVSWLEVVVAFLAGFQAGAFYAYSQRLGTHYFHSVILTANFFTAVIVTSYITGREHWEHWVGIWGLVLLFYLGLNLGYKTRKRWSKRSRNAH